MPQFHFVCRVSLAHEVLTRLRLERWAAGASLPAVTYEQGVEFYLFDGTFEDENGAYAGGTWLRLPVGASHPTPDDIRLRPVCEAFRLSPA